MSDKEKQELINEIAELLGWPLDEATRDLVEVTD